MCEVTEILLRVYGIVNKKMPAERKPYDVEEGEVKLRSLNELLLS